MPHYRNGDIAKIGDLVRGYGYNIKGEIVGVVTDLVMSRDNCNLKLAHNFRPLTLLKAWDEWDRERSLRNILVAYEVYFPSGSKDFRVDFYHDLVHFDIENGETRNFDLVIGDGRARGLSYDDWIKEQAAIAAQTPGDERQG